MTNKQQEDIETVIYFIPERLDKSLVTEQDKKDYLKFSERGIKPQKESVGYQMLIEGKRWRHIHAKELYYKDHLKGDNSWLGWMWIVKDMPMAVKKYLAKEIRCCSERILRTYEY